MKTILITDDERRIRTIYGRFLKGEGFNVIEAEDAIDANEILKKEKVDLVMLDIKMPEVDGTALYDVIKIFHKEMKVIVTSVYPLDEQRQIIKGAADYYDKSQGTDVLLKKVKRALGDKSINDAYIDDESRLRSPFRDELKKMGMF